MARTLVALMLLSGLGSAEAQTFRERFALFTDCAPVGLYIFVGQNEGDEIDGLSEQVIRNAVESRLRSARIYSDIGLWPTLNVEVLVLSNAYSIRFWLDKTVLDEISGQSSYAETWSKSGVGTHGLDSGYILSHVAQYTDEFLVEYLRVNETACASQ